MKHMKQKVFTLWDKRFRFELRAVWLILWEARRAFLVDGCMNLSAALAFYTILSLIPFLFLLIAGASYVLSSSETALTMTFNFFNQMVPHASFRVFQEVTMLSHQAGVIGWVGFLSMIWTASVIFSSLEFAMGVVFRVEQRRNFIKSQLLALSMVPGSVLVFLLSFSVTAFLSLLQEKGIQFWGINLAKSALLEFLFGYLFPYLILTLGFTAIYKIVPNTFISFRHALAGGASGAFLFELAKHFFTWYIRNYGRYSAIYGSLEAMIILVLWTFYSACILLFCAEVVSAYRRRDVTLLESAF